MERPKRPSEPRRPLSERQAVREIVAAAPPRAVQGLIAPFLGRVLAWPYRAALAALLHARVTPNQLTVGSLITSLAAAVLLARGERFVPGLLLFLSGLFDIFDGGLARSRGLSGPRGAWFDSVIDRAADAAIFTGLFLSLARQGDTTLAAVTIAALVVSLMVSYTRARAAALGVVLGEGLFARLERTVALIVGFLIPGTLRWALAALLALGAATLLQRVVLSVRELRRA